MKLLQQEFRDYKFHVGIFSEGPFEKNYLSRMSMETPNQAARLGMVWNIVNSIIPHSMSVERVFSHGLD